MPSKGGHTLTMFIPQALAFYSCTYGTESYIAPIGVPEAGFEPASPLRAADFKSAAYANSATQARSNYYKAKSRANRRITKEVEGVPAY